MKHLSVSASILTAVVLLSALSACGVRGRPQPPAAPAELGRGKPTFKRATEEYKFKNVPDPEAQKSDNKKGE